MVLGEQTILTSIWLTWIAGFKNSNNIMAILSFSGDVERFTGAFYPPSKEYQDKGIAISGSLNIQVFDERQNVSLSRSIKIAKQNPDYVDVPGAFANYEANLSDSNLAYDWDANYANLPELTDGAALDSHYIAFYKDPVFQGQRLFAFATIIFDSPIVGLIDSRDSDLTNDLFSFTNYVSPRGQTLEGLQWVANSPGSGSNYFQTRDYVKVTGENKNIIEIRWTSFGYEGLRVLTLGSVDLPPATPNPERRKFIGTDTGDRLNGTTNADILKGLTGNDVYIVNHTADEVIENPNEGRDTVNASVSYTLSDNVENLTLTGTDDINGTGNALANQLIGNSGINTLIGGAGNDLLDGKGGADNLQGGWGNDTYIVDNSGDIIVENPNEGTDIVNASVSYTLSDNVENLTLTGTDDIDGTGNAESNTIKGNVGNNRLDGKGGADNLQGGWGNDTYIVDNGGDIITENPNEGTDIVNASV
ncbi:MAG: calcium-binding protein, partial [Synechocystis sp.]